MVYANSRWEREGGSPGYHVAKPSLPCGITARVSGLNIRTYDRSCNLEETRLLGLQKKATCHNNYSYFDITLLIISMYVKLANSTLTLR